MGGVEGPLDEYKAKGNACFGKKEFFKAAGMYGKAIKIDPKNHLLYSNRSASFMKMERPKDVKALNDATKCTELKPNWAKGHYRRAQALLSLGRFDEALDASTKCVELDATMKKEAVQFQRSVALTWQINTKNHVEVLLSRESFSEFKFRKGMAEQEGLLIMDTAKRTTSFFEQMQEAVKLAALNATTLNPLNGTLILLPAKLDQNGEVQKFGCVPLPQTLLSEKQQTNVAKALSLELSSGGASPAHAFAFVTEKSKLLAPRKWEVLSDSLPAKSDGVFLQLESCLARTILFLRMDKGSKKDSPNTVGEWAELDSKFNILPSILFKH